MIKYCSQCGSQVRQGAVYCVSCGAILSSDAPTRPISLFPFGANAIASSFARREASFEKENVKIVRVSCKVLNVEVLSSEREKIQITWDESASWSVSVQQRGDCLQINEQSIWGLHNIQDFFTLHQRKDLRIELPNDYCGTLILENETGSISVSNLETDGRIEIKTTIGHIKGRNLKTKNDFCADTSGGTLSITNIDAERTVRLSSMTLGMQADKIRAGAGFSATGTNGRCQLKDIESAEYVSITGNVGQVILDSIRAAKIDVGLSGSGLVECKKIFAENAITITNSTGAITCGIDDDAANYTAHCRSVHGRCSLPEVSGNGPKLLRISTSIGNIDVQFKDVE